MQPKSSVTKKKILTWIRKQRKDIDDPDGEGSMVENEDADERTQVSLQMLDDFEEFIKNLKW